MSIKNDMMLLESYGQPEGWAWGTQINERGRELRFGSLQVEKPLAHIVYIEGLSEFAEKTFELARDFNRHSCSFWVLDRFGQGLSGRFLKDEFKQHSEGFHHDTADILKFIRERVPDDAPVILLGHSTGGLIAMLAAHDAPPETISGLVVTAPLLGFLDPLMNGREKILARAPLPRGFMERYIPGGGPWVRRDDPGSTLKPEAFSSHPDRMRLQDCWLQKIPGLRTGSPTVGWAKHVAIAMMTVRDRQYLEAIEMPVLLFTAGQDCLVENAHARMVVNQLSDAVLHHFENGKHELLMETDDIRNVIISDVIALAKKLGTPIPL